LPSAARPAHDARLELEAIVVEGGCGLPTAGHNPLMPVMRLKREAAARDAAELNDLHHAEIAMAHATVVYYDIATRAVKNAIVAEISNFSFDSSDAESDAGSCESSPEENSWQSEGGGMSAAAAVAEEEKGGLSAVAAAAAAVVDVAGSVGPRASQGSTTRGRGDGGGGAGLRHGGRGGRGEMAGGRHRIFDHGKRR
jgi:hypothetical protein